MSAHLLLTTAPNRTQARRLAQALLKKRLAACVHIFAPGESIYWWKGKLEKTREVTLLLKTTKKALPSLIRHLKEIHPYQTPEILALRVEKGHPAYLDWIKQETF